MSDIIPPAPHYSDLDPFWVEQRAEFVKSAESDERAQRATLLQAPDHPSYEILAGFPIEENRKLPARFHIPVFDDLGQPNLWLCAVCWEEGEVSQWPCATAQKYGSQVFTQASQAETAQKKLLTELAAVRAERDEAREQLDSLERNTLPDLRRQIQHHQDGKKRWRDRAEGAEKRLDAVSIVCDDTEKQATRWEHPLPVPEWVATVRRAAEGAAS